MRQAAAKCRHSAVCPIATQGQRCWRVLSASILPQLTAWNVVRICLGLLLITAAVLKGHELLGEPLPDTSIFTSGWFVFGLVEFELIFGLWLLFGLLPRAAWLAALMCFSGFAAISLSKSLAGDASCDCFGKVPVNPWLTLLLDLSAVAALFVYRPRSARVQQAGRHGWFQFLAYGVVLLPVVTTSSIVLANAMYGDITRDGMSVEGHRVVVADCESWLDKPLPLLPYIDIGDQLARGHWVVVLYRYDCGKCRMLLREFRERVKLRDERVALVEVPPFSETESLEMWTPLAAYGRLTDTMDWFVPTPRVIRTVDGKVVNVSGTKFVRALR